MYGYAFNPIFLFNFIFFLHNWSFSLSKHFFPILQWYTPNSGGDKYQDQLLFINLISLWSFFLGFIIFKKNSKIISYKIEYNFEIFKWLFYLTSIIALIQVFQNQDVIYGSDQAVDAKSSFNPLGILLYSHSIFGAVTLINAKSRRIIFIVLVLELLVAILTGTRKAFIIIIFTYLIANYEYIKLNIRIRTLIFTILGISFIFYLTVFVAIYRESFGLELTFNERVLLANGLIFNDIGMILVYTLNSANSEAVQTWVLELLNENKMDLTYGLTYIQGLINTIILKPFQGELVNFQAAYYFKNVAYPDVTNQGYDFSFTAEAILNFKYFAFVSYFILGVFLSKIYNYRLVNNYYDTLYILIIALLYIVLRTDSASFFRYLSFFVFTFFFLRYFKVIKKI